jgi:hypothetical protein
MVKRYGLSSLLVLLCLVLCAVTAQAQWVTNGVLLCNADYQQYGQRIVQDGPDGAIAVWTDYRNGSDSDIYANRIGTDGTIWGGLGGVPVCTATGNQNDPMVIANGADGTIFIWLDSRDGTQRIYAQKIDTTGTVAWTADGIDVCPDATYLSNARIAPDGVGGAIITWYEMRYGGSYDIFAQRIDLDGNLVWGSGGMDVCTYAGDQYNPEITADGSGGAIIAWWDYRSDGDIYAQRVDADGNLLWDMDGLPVCAASGSQYNPRLVAASGGGAFVTWMDARNGYEEVFAQWIDPDGAPLWQIDGVSATAGSWYNSGPQLVDDGAGGVIVAWYDYRSGNVYQVYAQRFDSGGATTWGSNGIMLMDSYTYSSELSMVPDGFGGAIVASDLYVDNGSSSDIYAQRVDRDGNVLWGPRAAVCLASDYQYGPVLAPDGSGGAIVVWQDYRTDPNYSDLYCQHMSASGLWGNPEPEIVSCLDLPGDQGGWVRIKTRASALDATGGGSSEIMGYNVWRMIWGGGPKAMSAGAASIGAAIPGAANAPAIDRSKLAALLADPATANGVRVSGSDAASLGLPPGEWESVAFWFATRDTLYNSVVPTKNDSTEAGTAEETFVVTAHSSTAGVFVVSQPVMGYSVDNLAPGMTPGFVGAESAAPPGLALSWNPNVAPDLWKYDVHRGDDESFVPDQSNQIGTTDGTMLVDGSWVKAYMYFYKLVAVDRHGNTSVPALLRPEDIKVGTMLASFAASLSGAVVEISWTLSEAGADARFAVLRSAASGVFEELDSPQIARSGLTFSMADRGVEPGTTYRYRVNVVEGSGSRTLFETQGISTPAMPLTLNQNHPNPFNPSTTIGYYLPVDATVTLEVYDTSGRLVARLLNGAKQAKGTHSVAWRGLDAQGRQSSSGVYFYRLTSGKETISKKMILLR